MNIQAEIKVISHVNSYLLSQKLVQARVIRCNLSDRFFCIHAGLLCEFQSDEMQEYSVGYLSLCKSCNWIIRVQCTL